MLASLRSALLICAALSAVSIAPARADSSASPVVASPVVPADSADLPTVTAPDLLDPAIEPQLSEPNGPAPESEAPSPTTATAVTPTGDLASMVAQLRSSDPGNRELDCLATGIYFEAKSETLAGQLAVGKVIANRAQSGGRFPHSYCGVLFQRGQFSFIRGHALPTVPSAGRQWQTAVALAKIVDQGLQDSPVGNALFFHARYVSPGWRLKRVAAIGNHVFYR